MVQSEAVSVQVWHGVMPNNGLGCLNTLPVRGLPKAHCVVFKLACQRANAASNTGASLSKLAQLSATW